LGTSGTGNPGRIGQGLLGTGGTGVFYTGAPGTTPTSPADFRDFNAATDRFVFSKFTPAYVPTEKWYIFGNGSYKLLENDLLQFFAETAYTRTERQNQFAPAPLVTSGGVSAAPGDCAMRVSNPYNVFGVPIDTWRYRPVELGPRTEENTADVFRAVAGFRGKIPSACNIEWEVGVFYNEDDRFHRFGHDVMLKLPQSVACAAKKSGFLTRDERVKSRVNDPVKHSSVDLLLVEVPTRHRIEGNDWAADIRYLPLGESPLDSRDKCNDEPSNFEYLFEPLSERSSCNVREVHRSEVSWP